MSGERAVVTVDFFADFVCPWCYVGWAALKRATLMRGDDVLVRLAWRSFFLNPDTPRDGLDRKAYLTERFDPAQLKAAHDALIQAAERTGAPLSLDAKRIPNTIDAQRLVHWAAAYNLAEPVIDALYQAYWVEGRDIGLTDVLVEIAEAKGLDPNEIRAKLAGADDRKLVLDFHAAALRIGVQGVPVAIFNHKFPVLGAESPDGYANALDAAATA